MEMDFVNGIAMASGDGIHSYTKNSLYQRSVMDAGMLLVEKSISEYIHPHALDTFSIADLGCSVGPNTFIAVDAIIKAVKLQYSKPNTIIPEFHVHFNDHALNDFNTLFKSLPPNREYYASAVPSSFYKRLFPRSSLHIVYSSYSLQWLSQVPPEILDLNSSAYNKGWIQYASDNENVMLAYERQHSKDFSDFLQARAHEIVPGGLLVLIVPARPNGVHYSHDAFINLTVQMGASFMDLAKKGVIDEKKVDTFNIPLYIGSPYEFEELINKNGYFDIEKMEALPEVKASYRPSSPEEVSGSMRAVYEGMIEAHFGHEILDDVFAILQDKIAQASHEKQRPELNLFMLLKRKQDDVVIANN